MNEIRKVLVTGAAGTVGAFIVKKLLKEGYDVVATDLSHSEMAKWWSLWTSDDEARGSWGEEASFVDYDGDLTDKKFVCDIIEIEKPDAIIHTAALVDVSLPHETLMKVNFDAAWLLYQSFKRCGGKIFVFLSSGSIYGNDKILTESSPISPSSPYEESKVLVEKFLEECCAKYRDDAPQVVILRPSLIYGPKNKFLAANYLAIAIILSEVLGKAMPKFFLGPKTNLVHAEDVAGAAVFLMEKKTWTHGMAHIFNIADSTPLGFGDHLRAMSEACGYKSAPIYIPFPPARLLRLFQLVYTSPIFLGALNRVLSYLWERIVIEHDLERGFTPKISRDMTPFFGQDTVFSKKKIEVLGFRLEHSDFRMGILDVVKWYKDKENRWIP